MDALMTSWGMRITKEIIGALERCVVIGVASVGVDMVDVEAATAAGIVVTNVPDVFIEEVADHAMMLLLYVARMTPQMAGLSPPGSGSKGGRSSATDPACSARRSASTASATWPVARPAGPRPSACTSSPTTPTSASSRSPAGVEPVGFGELFERSDFVSIHAPHNRETEHAIDAAALARMKPTGHPHQHRARLDRRRAGADRGAAGRVDRRRRPRRARAGAADSDNPLLTMDNVVVTPHVASATTRMRPETRRRVGREVAMVLRGRWPMSCVNPTVLPRVELERWQPYPMNRGPNR